MRTRTQHVRVSLWNANNLGKGTEEFPKTLDVPWNLSDITKKMGEPK